MKSLKQITFEELDKIPEGAEFSAITLTNMVNRRLSEHHYPDTYLRYIREYRQKVRPIENSDKKKSFYRVGV